MAAETLDFEEPIAVLLKEIEALTLLPHTDARDREIASLRRRIESVRADLYRSLTPWQRVLVARHPNRPGLHEYIDRLFPGFVEIHGDRRFADDHAIMTGFAEYHGDSVLVVGFTLFVATMMVLVNLVVDVLYAIVDPRVRY